MTPCCNVCVRDCVYGFSQIYEIESLPSQKLKNLVLFFQDFFLFKFFGCYCLQYQRIEEQCSTVAKRKIVQSRKKKTIELHGIHKRALSSLNPYACL